MTEFHEMSSQQLRDYRGPIYTARCVFHNWRTGNDIPSDYESPTRDGLDKLVLGGIKHWGRLLSITKTMRTQGSPASERNDAPTTETT